MIGRADFDERRLLENYAALIDEIVRAKPAAAKGRYIRTVTLTTTMGPGVHVDPTRTRDLLPEEAPPFSSIARPDSESLLAQDGRRPHGVSPAQAEEAESQSVIPARLRAGFFWAEHHEKRAKGTANRRDRRADRRRGGDLRGRLPRAHRAPGSGAAREPARADASFRIVKNTLTLLAADKAGVVEDQGARRGGTRPRSPSSRAIAALAAKVLDTFARQANVLEVKGGLMGGRTLAADEIRQLARLPARDVLNRPVGRHRGLAADRAGARARIAASAAWRSPSARSGRAEGGSRSGRA